MLNFSEICQSTIYPDWRLCRVCDRILSTVHIDLP